MDNNENINDSELDQTNSPNLSGVAHGAGNVVKKVGNMIPTPSKAAQTSGKAVDGAGKTMQATGKTMQATGKTVETAGKGMEYAGKGAQKVGQGVNHAGDAMMKAGASLTSTGAGAIGGVPLAILGGATKGIGIGTDIAGKGMEQGGKGVQTAGKGINKAGETVDNAGKKISETGHRISNTISHTSKKIKDPTDKLGNTSKIKKLIMIVALCSVPIVLMFMLMFLTAFASLSDDETFADFPKYDESMYNSDTLGIDYDCNLASITISHDYCSSGQSCRAHNANDISISQNLPSPNIYPLLEGEVVSVVNSCINDCEDGVASAWIHNQSKGTDNCNCGGQFGNQVVIESTYNGRKIYTRYAHMAAGSVKVSKGDYVTYNTILGVMGSTGMSEARHLHLELHWDNTSTPKFEPTDIFTDDDVKGTICGRSVSNPTDNEGEENDENTEVE